jgi:hypothetical protein
VLLARLLATLKGHEERYVSALMMLRREYLSHGRRWQDVEELCESLRAKAKRALDRAKLPDLAAAAKMVHANIFFSAFV